MSKQKKLLTLDDLYMYYSNRKKSCRFSAKDENKQIVVQVNGRLKFDENSDIEGLTPVILQSCHIGKNLNKSNIKESVMEEALPSFKNRPILGYIHEVDGQPEFYGHNMHLDGDDNVIYDEIPIGVIPESCNAHLEYDEDKDKTYCVVYGYIYNDYTKAKEILEREKECPVSVEISISEMSYSVKEKCLDIEKFTFSGVTILGKNEDGDDVTPGMAGANIKLKDFSVENNSMFSHTEINNKLVDTLEKLNSTLQSFNINNTGRKEEVIVEKDEKFEEEVTVEVTETEEETVVESTEEEAVTETEEQSEETVDETPNETVEETEEVEFSSSKTIDKLENYTRIIYEISHEDIRSAIYTLISPFEEEINDWLYITDVYNDHFICENWSGTNVYGCKYKTEDDNVSLDGEFYQLFKEVLTVEEKSKLDEMRSNYSAIKEKLDSYEKAELDEQKTAIFEDDSYSEYLETEEFKSLIADKDKYSVDELKDKAEIAFAKCVKKAGKFSANTSEHEDKKSSRHVFSKANSKEKKKSPYGNIFNKD